MLSSIQAARKAKSVFMVRSHWDYRHMGGKREGRTQKRRPRGHFERSPKAPGEKPRTASRNEKGLAAGAGRAGVAALFLLAFFLCSLLVGTGLGILRQREGRGAGYQRKAEHQAHNFLHGVFSLLIGVGELNLRLTVLHAEDERDLKKKLK